MSTFTPIAVVNYSDLDLKEITPVINAINLQIHYDLAKIWFADGYVAVLDKNEAVPAEHFVVELVNELDDPMLGGLHYFNERGKVFATVPVLGPLLQDGTNRRVPWSLALDHEILEMIVDPYGDHKRPGPSLFGDGDVRYLVEVCDPCQHFMHSQVLNGVVISDFYTPDYLDARKGGSARYSAYNTITQPRQILPGGYLCWCDEGDRWFRADWSQNSRQVTQRELFDFRSLPTGSLRQRIDYHTNLMAARGVNAALEKVIAKRFRSRIAKKLQEIARVRASLKARSKQRDQARKRHRYLHDQVMESQLDIQWSKPRQRKLR